MAERFSAGLDDLPDPILLAIFADVMQLGTEDEGACAVNVGTVFKDSYLTIAGVCSRWRRLFFSSILWRTCTLQFISERDFSARDIRTNRVKALRELKLFSWLISNFKGTDTITASIFIDDEAILEELSKVLYSTEYPLKLSMHVFDVQQSVWDEFAKMAGNRLEKLRTGESESVPAVSKYCTQLTTLTLTCDQDMLRRKRRKALCAETLQVLQTLPLLTELDVFGNAALGTGPNHILQALPNLRSLTYSNSSICEGSAERPPSTVSLTSSSLRYLDLGTKWGSDKILDTLHYAGLENISTLKVNMSGPIPGLDSLPASLTSLEVKHFYEGCFVFPRPDSVSHLVSLKYLAVQQGYISFKAVEYLSSLEHLVVLDGSFDAFDDVTWPHSLKTISLAADKKQEPCSMVFSDLPNLSKLYLVLRRANYSIVIKKCPCLRELSIVTTDVQDQEIGQSVQLSGSPVLVSAVLPYTLGPLILELASLTRLKLDRFEHSCEQSQIALTILKAAPCCVHLRALTLENFALPDAVWDFSFLPKLSFLSLDNCCSPSDMTIVCPGLRKLDIWWKRRERLPSERSSSSQADGIPDEFHVQSAASLEHMQLGKFSYGRLNELLPKKWLVSLVETNPLLENTLLEQMLKGLVRKGCGRIMASLLESKISVKSKLQRV
mmetsp:Transcript_11014/g.18000  ORF Transcript_11014/g.18000 Transcript_11014/m.18000 type:complete len:665 (-) Transcript_11014:92-2086(-)